MYKDCSVIHHIIQNITRNKPPGSEIRIFWDKCCQYHGCGYPGSLCHHFSCDHGIDCAGWTTWWCHQMETFSTFLALCAGNSQVTGEFPSQRPVTGSFDAFFDLCLKKRLSKPSRRWWFEMPWWSLWRHCNQWVLVFCEEGFQPPVPSLCWELIIQINGSVHYHSNSIC